MSCAARKKHWSTTIRLLIIGACLCGSIIRGENEQPFLLYSTQNEIRITNVTRTNYASQVVISNLSETAPFDYHYVQKKICWVDNNMEVILCAKHDPLDAENKIEIHPEVVATNAPQPVDIACDWITNKIYWTDVELNHVEVATMDGKYRKVLFWTDIDVPRAIALVPMDGILFWTDWGELPKIERANMDGDQKSRQVIISTNIVWPNGLSVDFEKRLLYWADGKLRSLEVVNFDGKNRRLIRAPISDYPFAISYFNNTIFWSDWQTWSLHYFNRTTNKTDEILEHTDVTPMRVHVYHPARQPPSPVNPCRNNGGCSHLCFLAPPPRNFTCACPVGVKLIDERNCAEGPEKLLVLATRNNICLVYLNSPEFSHKVLDLSNVQHSIAVDYDPNEGLIYWSDDEVKKIQAARLDGSGQHDVVSVNIQHPDGVAIDWAARNLYWTDAGSDHIEVCTLNAHRYRRVIISDNLGQPRAIAVAPQIGWLFWTDWDLKNPKIERANLDGSERIVVVKDEVSWPNGIALDPQQNKIFWCDAKSDRIEFADMDGKNRAVLISDETPHVFGFSMMGDYLYWTDWQKRTVERAHKEGGRREVLVDQMENVMGVKAIDMKARPITNLCSVNNGDCSQFCFYRHDARKLCLCELGYELRADNRTCVITHSFLLYAKKTKIGMIGIENRNNDNAIPVGGISHAIAVDYDHNNQKIFWVDAVQKTINVAYINGSYPQKIIDQGLSSPADIAVDWLGINIYWTDTTANRIEVARFSGTSRNTLLWEGKQVDSPYRIVLDPPNGYMYWSELGNSNTIKRADMNGSNVRKILTTKVKAVFLKLDHAHRRLYWINAEQDAIYSADLDGNDLKEIVKGTKMTGLATHRNYIYFSERNDTNAVIYRSRRDNWQHREEVHRMSDGDITDLVVYYNKSGTNQCAHSNGGCKHLCLALPSKGDGHLRFECACPTHHTLVKNECKAPSSFMIYSQKNLTVRLLPSPNGCLEAPLDIQGLRGVKAIDYDPTTDYLYWIEGKTQAIKRAVPKGEPEIVVQANRDLQPIDIAIDPLGQLLFWTCAIQNAINVTQLETLKVLGVVVQDDNEHPRLLALHPNKRLLFYTDVKNKPKLIRSRLDGSHKFVIGISKNDSNNITAIAIDLEKDCIVWVQGQKIYTSTIEGENQHVLHSDMTRSTQQLTIFHGWLYWIERETSQLVRLDLLSANQSTPLTLQASHIVDLISVSVPDMSNVCNRHRHTCAYHLCVLDGVNPVCACPKGYQLKSDNRTCSAPMICGEDRFSCSLANYEKKDCIPLSWRCDGQNDCKDGSDELNCHECTADQFKCQSGQCIIRSRVCDEHADCPDKSDEVNCCKDGHQCLDTKVCIPRAKICDRNDDCADGSDEDPGVCLRTSKEKAPANDGITAGVIVLILVLLAVISVGVFCLRKYKYKASGGEQAQDQSEDSLSPMQPMKTSSMKMHGGKMMRKSNGIPDVVRMSMLTATSCDSYDRNHITGASSSTNDSSLTCYPREPLNPPPSPATTRGSSPRYRPYRHYRAINQPPPPTPCSTDVCDESEYNYTTTSRYGGGPYPPPPTPRSQCYSESCPPSPSSRSSTYFNPLPPPPSPVMNSRR